MLAPQLCTCMRVLLAHATCGEPPQPRAAASRDPARKRLDTRSMAGRAVRFCSVALAVAVLAHLARADCITDLV
jgi:hypothetical protein